MNSDVINAPSCNSFAYVIGITYFTVVSNGAVIANKVKKMPAKTATKVFDRMETIATMTMVITFSKIADRMVKIDLSDKMEVEGRKLELTPNLGNMIP